MTEEQQTATPPEETNGPNEPTVEGSLEQAKRAFALRNFELAVEHYGTALELMSKRYGDASPECVDLYFAYGKALLENAIAQNSVLGKDGDNEEEQEEEQKEEQKEGNEEEAEGEPEDDFNAAWEVLEVARSLYEGQKDVGDDAKLKLADTYMALGDISLETEKLEQAAEDYTSAAALKTELLPVSSRQIAEVHYKLCIVYDMTSGQLAQAIEHARKAQISVQARLTEVIAKLGELSTVQKGTRNEPPSEPEVKVDLKGKGKATSTALEPSLSNLTKEQLEAEVKDLTELLEEVSSKIEELRTLPDTLEGSASELAARELDRELNGAKGSSTTPNEIHDLTNIVRKKRKAPESTKTPESEISPVEKKPKLESGAGTQ